MKSLVMIIAIFAPLNLSACNKPNDAEVPKPEAPKAKLFEEQRNVLESAKAVDKTQQQQTDEQKKLIEQQTQ